jgi:hypothetical protein
VVPVSSGWRGILARAGLGLENSIRRIRGEAFRALVHDVAGIEARIAAAGLTRVAATNRLAWYVAVYERSP